MRPMRCIFSVPAESDLEEMVRFLFFLAKALCLSGDLETTARGEPMSLNSEFDPCEIRKYQPWKTKKLFCFN